MGVSVDLFLYITKISSYIILFTGGNISPLVRLPVGERSFPEIIFPGREGVCVVEGKRDEVFFGRFARSGEKIS